ncbi:MAG TPA: MFS transporter, partial [Chitinophagaceae bacterium]
MAEVLVSLRTSNKVYRFAVASLFFLQGICFATWASRIPSIQQNLHLSDGALGLVLFALPAGSMLALPLSGWLVTRFGSKTVVINTMIIYAALLVMIGLASYHLQLIIVLVLFGMA